MQICSILLATFVLYMWAVQYCITSW